MPVSRRRSRRSILLAGGLAVSAAVALPSPATASDETLRLEIQQVFVEVRPALMAFRDAAGRVAQAPDTGELQGATDRLRDAVRRYRWGVINRRASSPRGLKAKRLLLTAIRQLDIGLVEYQHALEKVDAGASRRSVMRSLRTADRRITEASQDEAEALEALGVPATS